MKFLYRVNLRYTCAGVITDEEGVVQEAAPIFKWVINKHINTLINFYKKKGVIIDIKRKKIYSKVA